MDILQLERAKVVVFAALLVVWTSVFLFFLYKMLSNASFPDISDSF